MPRRKNGQPPLRDDPLWYKDAIIYELHIRAFQDSNADGIGDIRGLTERLDYLEDLGVTALWLLPFYPSPLRDDGYDIADYGSIHAEYGTMQDFKHLLAEAHRRGLRVITELVINHTSDQHAWFQRARQAKAGSALRNFYVWSDTAEEYADTRIIFKDFETSNWTFDPVANAHFWHRFYSHQPDLNFDNPRVRKAIFDVMDMWFEMGVDGMRLDAVPYLFEREGTSCENLPETHDFLRKLRAHVDQKFRNRMLLAEANQWPEDAAAYFGDGDECHMNFHFPLMPRLFMALQMEDRFPIIDILDQTPEIDETCQWALFLRNHDELTLEMVTDEERDYMYRMYAHDSRMRINLGIRRRLAPLLANNRRRIELLNGLLFSLPGTPVLYYGDEIGMGDNHYLGDRNGVRTPMQWSADRNAGFSRANPQSLYLPVITDPEYHHESINVEAQLGNPQSLLWWMKRLIAMRKRHPAFSRGALEFLEPSNPKILAFVRRLGDETILVVANLSRFVQCAEIEMHEHGGMVPVELFGQSEFPVIEDRPYFLTLGPHSFYWFRLVPAREELALETGREEPLPALEVESDWEEIFEESLRGELERTLLAHIQPRRWFGGKARRVKGLRLRDVVPVPRRDPIARIAMVEIEYKEGETDLYCLPLACAEEGAGAEIEADLPHMAIARIVFREGRPSGLLHDATADERFSTGLLQSIEKKRRMRGERGEVISSRTAALGRLVKEAANGLEPAMSGAEQSNTSIIFGDSLIMKIFRRLEAGENPDLEIGRHLTTRAKFPHTPAVAGALEYQGGGGEPHTLAILQSFVENEGDAWGHTRAVLSQYFEQVITARGRIGSATVPEESPVELVGEPMPEAARAAIGSYPDLAHLLGQRTAELHAALAMEDGGDAFTPEPFTPFYQRSLLQSMRNRINATMQQLRQRQGSLPENCAESAEQVLRGERALMSSLRSLFGGKISAKRTRIHGDYHLGQVLFTGRDYMIIDFEGEPSRSLGERRIKRSPLRDVAGMLRSYHYAAYASLFDQEEMGLVPTAQMPALETWARLWQRWVSAAFLDGYLSCEAVQPLLPRSRSTIDGLLGALVLDKALYELTYELNSRPLWVRIPLQAVEEIAARSA